MKFIDGKGLLRAFTAMEIGSINVKRADLDDLENIFKWHNNKNIHDASINSAPISRKEDQGWFDVVLTDKNHELVIGTIEKNGWCCTF